VSEQVDVRQTGERIESLLAELRSVSDPRTVAMAEDLVRSVVELYGAGLERVVALTPDGVDRLADDPLVESLLLLHGLHPLSVNERIERALDRARPYLGSHLGGVRLVGVDEDGVAHLQLLGTCDGCAASSRTVELTISGAVEAAAPEVARVEVEGVVPEREPALLQIARRSPDRHGGEATGTARPRGTTSTWVQISDPGLAPGTISSLVVADRDVVLCEVGGTVFAYEDCCPRCSHVVSGGALDVQVLTCPGCGTRYDVQRAGVVVGVRDGPPGTDGHRGLGPIPLTRNATGLQLAFEGASP